MDFIFILLISLALAMDTFAISICMSSVSGVKLSDYLKIPLHFGVFHVIMVLLGYYIGVFFRSIIQGIDHWVAFILLCGIGIKISFDSLKQEKKMRKISSEGVLLMLSLATSIDALVIGITFAFASALNLSASALILCTTVMTISVAGLFIGGKIHNLKIKYIGVLGGLVLIILGIKTLFSHVL